MTLREKLEEIGQSQLLKFEDEITPEEKEKLYKQIESIDFGITKALDDLGNPIKKGKISPLEALDLKAISSRKGDYSEAGVKAIKEGKVGAVLLAGGMGTRLGSNDPKGMYNIGLTKPLYIFECLINNLTDVVKETDTYIYLYVMTSDLNYESTTEFFREHDYFGYPADHILFFKQEMAPCCDYNGNILLEKKYKVAVSPNGNGGWFLSMMKAGILNHVHEHGIELLNVFSVDNVLQRICDPVFVGATLLEGQTVGAKVVRKNDPDEKVGVMCLEDGRPSIIEYYDLTDKLRDQVNDKGERVYNFGVILNYLFHVDELEKIVNESLPYHVVEKKIPCLDRDGNEVKPENPNGYKFEQLVLDMIHLAKSCLPFEVDREREFAPVKNRTGVDSVETARTLLEKNGKVL